MKELVIGAFSAREDAEKAINRLHREAMIGDDEISYIYRSANGRVQEVDTSRVSSSRPAEGATRGAITGGALGGVAGLAVAAGMLPVLGPIVAAGPLVSALGLGAGALGTGAAGAVTGAAAGGLIGALTSWGMDEETAQRYEDRVQAGEILVSAHTEDSDSASQIMEECGATYVESVTPAL